MKYFSYLALGLWVLMALAGCGGNGSGDPTGFDPSVWYGKTRADMAKIHPNITLIGEDMSSGPFDLPNAYGVKLVSFTFEDSWQDGLLRSVTLTWEPAVDIQTAAKKFGLDVTGLSPKKAPRYWEYAIHQNGIKFFNVALKANEAEGTPVNAAWIIFAND